MIQPPLGVADTALPAASTATHCVVSVRPYRWSSLAFGSLRKLAR